jgi:hypothetical protein
MRAVTRIAQVNVRRVVTAGAIVAAGSYLSLGPDLLRELELLQDACIDPWDVLPSATTNAAVVSSRGGAPGSRRNRQVGRPLIGRGRPDHRRLSVNHIAMIVKGGTMVNPTALLLAGKRPTCSAVPGHARLNANKRAARSAGKMSHSSVSGEELMETGILEKERNN